MAQKIGQGVEVAFSPNDRGNPPGKLADAELRFTEGPLAGLKLVGFGIWERRNGIGRNVTYPARQYSVNGERRSFALLRPFVDPDAQRRLTDAILSAYDEDQAERSFDDAVMAGQRVARADGRMPAELPY